MIKVIREGVIVGLANHTLLIAKGGTEYPIDESRRRSEERYRALIDASSQVFWTANADGKVIIPSAIMALS